jgi:hypothetical protein
MKKKPPRRKKMPVRLDAKPTKPHSTQKGERGCSRKKAQTLLRRELEQANRASSIWSCHARHTFIT